MSVRFENFAVYGYRFDGRINYDKLHREDPDKYEQMHQYTSRETEVGDVLIAQDPRGGRYLIAGILNARTNDSYASEPTFDDPVAIREPDDDMLEKLERIVDNIIIQDNISRKTDEPEPIVFTHNS